VSILNTYFVQETSWFPQRQKRKIYSQARCDDCCLLYQRAKGLAEEFNITDSLGKRWNFQTHQFRHTVETRMVNSGVPMHIIQRYLGHESPAMTQVYAHIHGKKKKLLSFIAK